MNGEVAPRCRPTRPAPGVTCVDPVGRFGYVVRSTTSSNQLFVERHEPDGAIAKTCAPNGEACRSGRWT